jgi:hypothetical protein
MSPLFPEETMNTYVPDFTRQQIVYPGNYYCLLMPYSEATDHMRIAGTVQHVLVKENGVYLDGGDGPHLTFGEAGIYSRRLESHPLWGTPYTVRWSYGMKLASDEKAETL